MIEAREDEMDLLAAEYVLGLLEKDDRVRAERLMAEDAGFAALVATWQERLMPLLDEVEAVEAPAGTFALIDAAIASAAPLAAAAPVAPAEQGGNVVQLRRRVTAWKTYSAAISAMAAALLLVVGLDTLPSDAPRPPARQPMLVANVAAEDRSAAFVVSFEPAENSLLITPAVASPASGHDHQLWLIDASGTPKSLGLIASTSPHRIPLPSQMRSMLQAEATLAISVEPVGGSPTGLPTGPVVASGKLKQV